MISTRSLTQISPPRSRCKMRKRVWSENARNFKSAPLLLRGTLALLLSLKSADPLLAPHSIRFEDGAHLVAHFAKGPQFLVRVSFRFGRIVKRPVIAVDVTGEGGACLVSVATNG